MAAKDQVRVVPVQSSDKYFGLSEKSLDGNAFSDWVVISDTLGQPGLGIPGRVDVMGITAFLIAPGEIGVNWQRKCEIARWLDGLAAFLMPMNVRPLGRARNTHKDPPPCLRNIAGRLVGTANSETALFE
jgi:hypothetical protein